MVVATSFGCGLAHKGSRFVAVTATLSMSVAVASLSTSMSARADSPRAAGAAEEPGGAAPAPPSVFIIAKNHNRNQVHYGVQVDDACAIVGAQPVYGFWRMFERRGEVEPLLDSELSAYGVDPNQRIERSGDTTTIHTRLNAAPDRPVTVTVKRVAGRCETHASTSIAGSVAVLRWVYVRFRWPFGVDYILLHGARVADGVVVEERI